MYEYKLKNKNNKVKQLNTLVDKKMIISKKNKLANKSTVQMIYNINELYKKTLFSNKFVRLKKINIKRNLYIKYNQSDLNKAYINNILANKNSHYVSSYKDCVLFYNTEEYLKRKYNDHELKDRLLKIFSYYKNYLKFFCKPFFRNFCLNKIILVYSDLKAELYYKNNYNFNKDNEDNNTEYGNIFNRSIKYMIEQIKNKSILVNSSLMTCNYMITNRSKDNSLMNIFHTLNEEIKKNDNIVYRRVHTDSAANNKRIVQSKLNYKLNFNNKLYIASSRLHITPKKQIKSEIIKERPNLVKLSLSAKLNLTSRNDEKIRYNSTYSNKKSNFKLNIIKDTNSDIKKDRILDKKISKYNKITRESSSIKYLQKSNFNNYMKAKVNLTSPARKIVFSNYTTESIQSEYNIPVSKVRLNNISSQVKTSTLKFNNNNQNNVFKCGILIKKNKIK